MSNQHKSSVDIAMLTISDEHRVLLYNEYLPLCVRRSHLTYF